MPISSGKPTASIDRRTFLKASSLTAGAVLLGHGAIAQAPTPGSLRVPSGAPGTPIPKDFIGLSYENMQLEDDTFFSPRNKSLIEQFRAISSHGVLRLGGNTSEFGWWKAQPSQAPPDRHIVLKNGDRPMATLFAITPQAIQELDGFLKATGWTCIYGLNLGYGTPQIDVPEAQYVFNTLGTRLLYFQVGNEVDNFTNYHLRDADTWNVNTYLQQWLVIARAVQKAIPNARFGMPDVASKVDWLTGIADQWGALSDRPHVITLSHHHYWSGPPSNPNATIERLLQPDPVVVRQAEISRQAAAKMGTTYRMTEGNTIYRGGKSGLSDVFASALWAADYLLELMHFGYSGVNLHGGSGHAQAVSVGGTFVGEAMMKNPNEPHPKPFYTPIANQGTLAGSGVDGKLNGIYLLEPVGYGMKFVSDFAGLTMLPVEFNPGSVNAVAYAARRPDGKVLVAILNKDEEQDLSLPMPPYEVQQLLTASSLQAKEAHILSGSKAVAAIGSSPGMLKLPKSTGLILALRAS
jgi:hypothetical protein